MFGGNRYQLVDQVDPKVAVNSNAKPPIIFQLNFT